MSSATQPTSPVKYPSNAMNIDVTYDSTHDVWTILHHRCNILSSFDIQRWKTLLQEQLLQLKGKKVFLLIDLNEFSIEASMMNEYGRHAKEIVQNHCIGVIRYGQGDAKTRTEISLQAIVNNFPANIFPNRESALAAVEHLRHRAMQSSG